MSGFASVELTFPAILIDSSKSQQGNDVVVKGGQTTDYPASGGKRLPPGAVVVKETGDGLYYLADAADGATLGDLNLPAIVTSVEAPDADWKDKTLTWRIYPQAGQPIGGSVVASGADDDTIAEWVTLLNSDPAFAAHLIASDSGGDDFLVITTRQKGNIGLEVDMDLDTAFDDDDGATSGDEARGTEADYRVVTAHRDLVDVNNASYDSQPVPTLLAGRFKLDQLTHLTDEARSVLEGRGSQFV